MTTAISQKIHHPADLKTGLTLPLSKSLGSQELAGHRAMVAVEIEVLAKKFDRFGWERDRGSAAHDRLITDWMDALQDFPLNEVRVACKAAVITNPNKMPNEGHVRAEIMKERKKFVAMRLKPEPETISPKKPNRKSGDEILNEMGFKLHRINEGAAQ
jgi:hypothetical protein